MKVRYARDGESKVDFYKETGGTPALEKIFAIVRPESADFDIEGLAAQIAKLINGVSNG